MVSRNRTALERAALKRSGEGADPGEQVQMRRGDRHGLHGTHGEARHGAVVAVCKRTEGAVDLGDQVVHDQRLKGVGRPALARQRLRLAGRGRIATFHHH